MTLMGIFGRAAKSARALRIDGSMKAIDRKRERQAAPRRRLSPTDRRELILKEAIRYFAEVGFDGGTRQLADRLDITQPLLYRYFPTKDALIREVYERVFLGRWRGEWDDLLTDRTQPLRDRLVAFYKLYAGIVSDPEWIRIYLFSGLRGIEINKWYITFVEERLLKRICGEVRRHAGFSGPDVVPIQPLEIEAFWNFHGGIFYYGVRREVYKVPVHVDLATFVEASVDSLLEGLPAVMRRAVATA